MKKLTKIIATIGPASDSLGKIEELIKKGVNIFRFNFKHNTVDWHAERIKRVNLAAEKLNTPIGTLIDLQGPEIRIKMQNNELAIDKDDLILLDEKIFTTRNKAISISHPSIINYLTDGQKISADDGTFRFTVKIVGKHRYLRSSSTGILKNNKSLNIPGADFPLPVLIKRDFEGLRLAEKAEVDFIALSFVRSAEDILILRREMQKIGLSAKVIAKIETQRALDNFDAILEVTDGVMVARGDLGVELPMEQVPYHQKNIIKKCLQKGVPVITATQMLESMVTKPSPTRAEVSDIANAVYDFTDAVMLSAESATGAYPQEAVEVMAKTVMYNEQNKFVDIRSIFDFECQDQEQRMADAAYNLYFHGSNNEAEVAAFVVFTQTGRTARLLARYRPTVPIYAFCPNKKVAESLTIDFGVYPFVEDKIYKSKQEIVRNDILNAINFLKNKQLVKKNKKLVVLHGDFWAVEGGTSTVKVLTVG